MPREEAEQRRGFDPDASPKDRAKVSSLFIDDLLDAKVWAFIPRYAEAEGALPGRFRHLHADIYGNREFAFHYGTREGTDCIRPVTEVLKINEETVQYIVGKKGGDGNKVINLMKSICKKAEDESDDPYLIAMADRARARAGEL